MNTWGISWGSCWANAWAILSPSDEQTGGGFVDYKKYRKYLEDLIEATKTKTVTKPLQKAVQRVIDLPVKAPELKKVLYQKPVEIDYEKINNEIMLIYDYLNIKIEMYEAQLALEAEKEDELILIMAI